MVWLGEGLLGRRVHFFSELIKASALLFIMLVVIQAVVEIKSCHFFPPGFFDNLLELADDEGLDAVEDLGLGLKGLVDEVGISLVQLLVDIVNPLHGSLPTVLHCLSLRREVALLPSLLRNKLGPELAQLFIPVLPHRDQAVAAVEDDGESVGIAEVAVVGVAGEGAEGVGGGCREGAGELDEGEVVVGHIHLQQLDQPHQS